MQFLLFYDYFAIINSCSFLKKYDALFQAFDMFYDQPDFPALGLMVALFVRLVWK